MNRILIVEPDAALREKLCAAIRDNETEAVGCECLASARALLEKIPWEKEAYQIAVVDTQLPDGNGYNLVYELKNGAHAVQDTSVIVILPNDEEPDAAELGGKGIADYITKPFSTAVLLAKIHTQFEHKRKNYGFKAIGRFEATGSAGPIGISGEQQVAIDQYAFDFDAEKYSVAGREVSLSRMEQSLLRILVGNRGIVLKRNALIERLKTEDKVCMDIDALADTVNALSEKLAARDYIKTVFGIGYMWALTDEGIKGKQNEGLDSEED